MKLILTRHGETEENVKGIIQGHLPGTLNNAGIEQAKKLAQRLKNEKIDYVYSSDLKRASDTTREIMKFHPKVPVEYTKELREKYLGEWQGKTKLELGHSSDTSLVALSSKDGEKNNELIKRAERFLHHVLTKHLNDNVLFVCHNGIAKAIIAVIMGKKPEEINSIDNLGNTSVSIFEIEENKKHKIHLLNCTEHLK